MKKKSSGNSGIDGAILKYMDAKTKGGMNPDRIFAHFMKKYSVEKIESAIMRLERRDLITISDKGKILRKRFIEKPADKLIGKIDLAQSGVAYVIIDGFDKDIKISRKHTMNAMSGDMVEVELTSFDKKKPEGRVKEIVRRAQNEFICKFQKTEGFGFAVPNKDKVPFDIFIPESWTKEAKTGDVVVVHIVNWNDTAGKNPVGKIVEKLSGLSPNELEMRSILMEQGFNIVFPSEVMQEVEKISDRISKSEIAERLDFRKVLTFTIDPWDAKDFDDAISIQELSNGNMEVGVHIADVAHYIRPNSALDKEAQLRATSVYLPDRVCPMLPEKLSNQLCSLRPNEDKCAFSVLFEVNDAFKIVEYSFAKTIINSDRRFAYEEVQAILDAKEGELFEELDYLNRLAYSLRAKRFKNGAVNFESDEVRFKLDENAVPIEVYTKDRKDANLLIEDFMLLANTTVAKYLSKLDKAKGNQASVYRVHDKPDMSKLQVLSNVAKRFGYSINFSDEDQARDALNNLMEIIQGKPEIGVLGRLAVRSMAKAAYSTSNIGHYGLAYEFYTHFTSPIRRYPDVLVHRLLLQTLMKNKPLYSKDELEELCKQSSLMERQAQKAEREAIKYKQVEYLSTRIGQQFSGIISGVIARGFFVELDENKCEGFVSLQNFNEDFLYDEDNMRVTGLSSRQVFQIGQEIKVLVKKTSLKDKQIDFEIVE
ncbi:MAG: ribonuclease R [Chitinophagales bacterium]|nr:ribonuclease R [Chitinophagales bacterium]